MFNGVSFGQQKDDEAQKYFLPDESLLTSNIELTRFEYESMLRIFFSRGYDDDVILRMVCLPSFQREWLVGMYSRITRIKKNKEYLVFLLRPDKQIWSTVADKNKKEDFYKIKLELDESAIDKDSAEMLIALWNEMLSKSKYPQIPRRMGFDGASYHFSSDIEGRGRIAGWTWSPDKDTDTGRLAEIGKLLADYAKGEPDKRKDILKTIRTKAEELQKRIKE